MVQPGLQRDLNLWQQFSNEATAPYIKYDTIGKAVKTLERRSSTKGILTLRKKTDTERPSPELKRSHTLLVKCAVKVPVEQLDESDSLSYLKDSNSSYSTPCSNIEEVVESSHSSFENKFVEDPKDAHIYQMIQKVIDDIWLKYDKDKNGVLDKNEARRFLTTAIY